MSINIFMSIVRCCEPSSQYVIKLLLFNYTVLTQQMCHTVIIDY